MSKSRVKAALILFFVLVLLFDIGLLVSNIFLYNGNMWIFHFVYVLISFILRQVILIEYLLNGFDKMVKCTITDLLISTFLIELLTMVSCILMVSSDLAFLQACVGVLILMITCLTRFYSKNLKNQEIIFALNGHQISVQLKLDRAGDRLVQNV